MVLQFIKGLIGILLGVGFFMIIPPIQQDINYHNFADQRILSVQHIDIHIPNFLDVSSNLIFLFVGLYGIYKVFNIKHKFNWSYVAYFLGVIWTCFGSAYYHWNPNNNTLIWDRLPMSVVFMILLSLILENDYPFFGKVITQILLVGIGMLSVLIWGIYDDLRLYILVQFGSLIISLIIVVRKMSCYIRSQLFDMQKYIFSNPTIHYNPNLVNNNHNNNNKYVVYNTYKYLLYGFIYYILAKLCEYFDHGIYKYTFYLFSGHTIKHILAGMGAYYCGVYLLVRKDRTDKTFV